MTINVDLYMVQSDEWKREMDAWLKGHGFVRNDTFLVETHDDGSSTVHCYKKRAGKFYVDPATNDAASFSRDVPDSPPVPLSCPSPS